MGKILGNSKRSSRRIWSRTNNPLKKEQIEKIRKHAAELARSLLKENFQPDYSKPLNLTSSFYAECEAGREAVQFLY